MGLNLHLQRNQNQPFLNICKLKFTTQHKTCLYMYIVFTLNTNWLQGVRKILPHSNLYNSELWMWAIIMMNDSWDTVYELKCTLIQYVSSYSLSILLETTEKAIKTCANKGDEKYFSNALYNKKTWKTTFRIDNKFKIYFSVSWEPTFLFFNFYFYFSLFIFIYIYKSIWTVNCQKNQKEMIKSKNVDPQKK